MIIKHILWSYTILFFLYGCAPKTGEITKNESKVSLPSIPEKAKPLDKNPCRTLAELPSELRSNTEDAFVIYRDDYKLKNYKSALEYWRVAYNNAPNGDGAITYHFDDGIRMYKNLISNASETEKRYLVDTIMMIYDKRSECRGDEITNQARKAFDLYYDMPGIVDEKAHFEMFRKVLDTKKDTADYFIINPFSRMVYDFTIDEKITKDEGSRLANQLLSTLKYGLMHCKEKECEPYNIINDYTPTLLEGLEGYEDFYDCKYYTDKYFGNYLEDSTNCDVIQDVFRKLIWGKCGASKTPEIMKIADAKYRLCKPTVVETVKGPLSLASEALDNGKFNDAIAYYMDYYDKSDDNISKSKALLTIAHIYYVHLRKFGDARKYALKSAKLDPSNGEPYMLIGRLYASSGPICGPGRGWDSQIVTWPAIDKFIQAKSIDSRVAKEANKLINTYRKFMPNNEDIFSRLYKEGQSFKVGCWIQESTTIRAAD